MSFTHYKWEKSGQTLHAAGTNQYMYRAGLGEQQTWDGLSWLPYLWKGASNELQAGHAPNVIEFTSNQQILKAAGQTICSSMKFFVQAYIGGEWVSQTHGLPTKNIIDDYPGEGRCTGYLDFPDAHLSFGAQDLYELKIGLEVGRSKQAIFGFKFRAPVTGQVRFQVVLDGLEKLPTDWEWIWATYDSNKSKEDRKIGIRFKDLEWRWAYDETPERDISVETNIDQTKKVTITFGPYDYIQNEWLEVYPDTWGATTIQADNDDCQEENDTTVALDGLDTDGDQVGVHSENSFDFAGLWDVTFIGGKPSSVDAGTKMSPYITWVNTDDPDVIEIDGIDEDATRTNDGDWNTGSRPSQRAHTTATQAWSPNTGKSSAYHNARMDTPELNSIVSEIVSRAGWSNGNAIGLRIKDNGSTNNYYFQIQDHNHSAVNSCTLTIVYTAMGGNAPTGTLSGPLFGPFAGPI